MPCNGNVSSARTYRENSYHKMIFDKKIEYLKSSVFTEWRVRTSSNWVPSYFILSRETSIASTFETKTSETLVEEEHGYFVLVITCYTSLLNSSQIWLCDRVSREPRLINNNRSISASHRWVTKTARENVINAFISISTKSANQIKHRYFKHDVDKEFIA